MMTQDTSPEAPLEVAEEVMPPSEEDLLAERTEYVSLAAKALQELLERQPTAWQDIAEILKDHLQRPLTADSATTLFASMSIYSGDEGTADLVLGVLTRCVADKELRDLLEGALDGETRVWVRSLLARYGSRLREAWVIGGENPKAWRSVNRSVLRDPRTGDWLISFEIVTYSGESLKIEETPTTLLLLASAILDTLNQLPEEDAAEAVAPDRRDEFMGMLVEFVGLFVPDSLQQAEDEVASSEETLEPANPVAA